MNSPSKTAKSISRWRHILPTFVFLLSGFVFAWTCQPVHSEETRRLSGSFEIGRDGRLILLPIQMHGRTFSFLLDTGASRTGFDLSLRDELGSPVGRQRLQTHGGATSVETFSWPEITLNDQKLRSDRDVVCIDLARMRQASSLPIYGVVGMDVLKSQCVRIDFDRGVLEFLDSGTVDGSAAGTRIRLGFFGGATPYLMASPGESVAQRFLIDTGAQGNSLQPDLFDRLFRTNKIRAGSSFASMTVAGQVQGDRGYLNQLAIGSLCHEGLRMSRVGPNSLGLRFLSRYQAIFDFPNQVLYLREGAQLLKPEPHASCGMSIVWINDQITVESVKPSGAASKADLQPGDVLVEVDGKPATAFDQFSLRELMTFEAGKTVSVLIQREGREIAATMILEAD